MQHINVKPCSIKRFDECVHLSIKDFALLKTYTSKSATEIVSGWLRWHKSSFTEFRCPNWLQFRGFPQLNDLSSRSTAISHLWRKTRGPITFHNSFLWPLFPLNILHCLSVHDTEGLDPALSLLVVERECSRFTGPSSSFKGANRVLSPYQERTD